MKRGRKPKSFHEEGTAVLTQEDVQTETGNSLEGEVMEQTDFSEKGNVKIKPFISKEELPNPNGARFGESRYFVHGNELIQTFKKRIGTKKTGFENKVERRCVANLNSKKSKMLDLKNLLKRYNIPGVM